MGSITASHFSYMTAEEFKAHFKKEGKSEDNQAYFSCACIIGIGVYTSYLTNVDNYFPFAIFPLLTFSLGFYCIWRVSKRHLVKVIKSTTTIDRKIEILKQFEATFERHTLSKDGNLYLLVTARKYFLSDTYYYAFFDQEKVLLYIGGPTYGGDVLDFGHSQRRLTKIHKYFLEHL